jgi:hypothetical protein
MQRPLRSNLARADLPHAREEEHVSRPGPDDAADRALVALVAEIDVVVAELERARERALQLQEERRRGRSWEEIVVAEERPLIVEQISSAMASLSTVGGQWRREQAAALSAEDVRINRIAALYGVTRQRVSALLRDHHAVPAEVLGADAVDDAVDDTGDA